MSSSRTEGPLPKFSPSWDEGGYFDLWMAVHFISGVAGGFSNVFFDLGTSGVLVVAVLLMLLWELFEYSAGVREAMSNRVIDIAVGLLGVLVALWVSSQVTTRVAGAAFAATFAMSLAGMALGIRAYRRRNQAAAGAD